MTETLAIFDGLGPKLAAHVTLSAAALCLAILFALPLAVWSSRSPRFARFALVVTSLIQTIPALALLALFFPVLLSLGRWTGLAIPALGFLPALIALTLYALLPILRNAVTARQNMDPTVLEAADAVGMTPGQKLRLVEAPLAMPFVAAGVRTAAVWTIGAATLATMVGQPSLGDPIFSGLQIQNWSLVLGGCVAAAGLALAVDALIGLISRGLREQRPWRIWTGIAAIAVGVAASLIGQGVATTALRQRTVVVGAKNFSEQLILSRLLGDRLSDAHYSVSYREGLGSSVAYKALATGGIDVYVDYAGTLLANEMHSHAILDRNAAIDEISRWAMANGGVRVMGPLGFENAYAFVMREQRARELGVVDISSLSRHAPDLSLGSDLEFLERPEWRSVRDAYTLQFGKARSFAPSLMYDALASGEVDVISAFSSDGRIDAGHLVADSD